MSKRKLRLRDTEIRSNIHAGIREGFAAIRKMDDKYKKFKYIYHDNLISNPEYAGRAVIMSTGEYQIHLYEEGIKRRCLQFANVKELKSKFKDDATFVRYIAKNSFLHEFRHICQYVACDKLGIDKGILINYEDEFKYGEGPLEKDANINSFGLIVTYDSIIFLSDDDLTDLSRPAEEIVRIINSKIKKKNHLICAA